MIRQLILVCMVAALPAIGQQVKQRTERKAVHEVHDKMVFTGSLAPGGQMHTVQFKSRLLKGAPYAAESVTETIQVLADGNRIVNKQSGKEYRDSEGRMRHDSTIQPVGPWVAGLTSMMSMIDDPVSGEHITLNHDAKVAHKLKTRAMSAGPVVVSDTGENIQQEIHKEIRIESSREVTTSGTAVVAGGTVPHQRNVMTWTHMEGGEGTAPRVESLGKRTIEGVECEGTKETLTIEAGKIGNERPIEIVTERWQSAGLGVDVLRKHSDPRFGETNYRLQAIVRGEQPKSLFEAPADYKVEELGRIIEDKVMRRTKEKE